MNKCSTASSAHANGGYATCDQISKKELDANHVSLRAQNRDCKNRQGPGPGHVTTHNQEPRECSFSTVSTSSVAPHTHQRRWSADFCKCGTSPVIAVRKSRKEPQPPQRRVSLLQPNTADPSSFKRCSCPLTDIFSSPRHLSSSSSSSSTSFCSSPPPVQTSVITGHDPRGWKLRPKSSCTSAQARTKRLSLQIPLPVTLPDSNSSAAPNSQSDNTPNPGPSPKSKPPHRPKPFRRCHSDSSAFLRSLPAVTLEKLCAVRLRPLTLSDESDDVFSRGIEEKVKATTQPRKIPPLVPMKTSTARQIAQMIGHSRQHCKTNEENIYTCVIKPKPEHSHQTEDQSTRHDRKNAGLRVDTSCDRESSTPRFPG